MKRKQGISLIVLVITIIVMIILAASVVITLSNTGVINKAGQAVQITDTKQIEQLVNMAWADAYAGGKRTEQELKEAVEQSLTQNKVNTDKIAIGVTDKGVIVSDTIFEVYPLEVPLEVGHIIQLKAKIPADYENVYVEFDYSGTKKKVEEYKVVDGLKVFSYNLSPQLMYKEVGATLYATYKGEVIEKTVPAITIENYAKGLIQKSASELNMSETKFSALKTLVADMLEYGAMAQIYRNKDIDKLVNKDVTGKSEYVPVSETLSKLTNHNVSQNTYFKSISIHFNYINALAIKIYAKDISKVTLKINGVAVKNEDFTISDENIYYINSNLIYSQDFYKLFTIELYEGNTHLQTLEYSASSYVYQYQNKTQSDGVTLTAMADLVRALRSYYSSAENYKNTK